MRIILVIIYFIAISTNMFAQRPIGKSTIKRVYVRDAAYAYNYWYPESFKEVLRKSGGYSDTGEYVSKDARANFKVWTGRLVSFPLGTVDSAGKFIGVKEADIKRAVQAVDNYITLIEAGKENEIGKARISYLKKTKTGYIFTISVEARDSKRGYVYKIELSEIPVSGDLIFKHFLFRYSIPDLKKYKSLGMAMAKEFGI